MMHKVKAGIVGVSGYGGGEVARLLAAHPLAQLVYATSNTYDGKPLSAALPGFAGRTDLVCEPFSVAKAAEKCDVLFLAGELDLAFDVAPKLHAAGKKVIDLSAAFRLKDPAAYPAWYKTEHKAPALLAEAAYGLPELNRAQIKKASLVANPGCYPTSAALALAPLLAARLADLDTLIVDSYSGVSGAGRSKFGLDYHFSEVNESLKPYGVGTHRHTPEIEQSLAGIAGKPVTITFTPHLAPITRGILTTAYAKLIGPSTTDDLFDLYDNYYKEEPFVIVRDPGDFPATKHVLSSNACHIGVAYDKRTGRAVIVAAIDNLVKGMAGEAVQNMNLISGLDETAGLTQPGLWP